MLGPIAAVTISTRDLERAIDTYGRYLDYRVLARGPIPGEQARSWGSPALEGRASALLAPASASDFRLRLVERRTEIPYAAFRHFGWNAAEFIVQNVDALAPRFERSEFRVLGLPAELSFSRQIRAMQVLAPDGEALYLTQIEGEIPGLVTPRAAAPVDRVFIVILGGRSVEDLQEYYGNRFAVPKAPIVDSVISVMSRAYDLPPRHLHRLAAMPLQDACYIEADAMPAAAQPRPEAEGELPPAIAMVTFRCRALPPHGLLSAPAALSDDPYRGRRSAVCRGPVGELIELIEE